VDDRAVDVAGRRGRKERDDVGQLVHVSDPAERIVLANSWAIAIIGSMAGVRVGPGATALTRMFCGPYSAAHALVSSSIAAREAP